MSNDRLARALASVRAQIGDIRPEIALVLGSGLGDYADQIDGVQMPYAEIDGFPLSTAPNHKGVVHIGQLHGRSVIAFQGRLHLYEGHSPADAGFPIELAHALGATSVVLTNISGNLNPSYQNGEIIGISDHLYLPGLTGQGVLVGRQDAQRSPFVNLTQTYDSAWLASTGVAQSGVYACLAGPHFETPAEGRMLRALGADMVGMSTVHEAVIARYLEMRVLALSLIVNPVITDPDSQTAMEESEIWDVVRTAAPKVEALLDKAIDDLPLI